MDLDEAIKLVSGVSGELLFPEDEDVAMAPIVEQHYLSAIHFLRLAESELIKAKLWDAHSKGAR